MFLLDIPPPPLFQAQANNTNVEPGSTVSIPFTVSMTSGGVVNTSGVGTFTVRANNDRSFSSSSPSSVTAAAGSGGTANGTVTLTVPASAVSGTDVTLTIEAENAAASDINYAVLRFSVVAEVREKGVWCKTIFYVQYFSTLISYCQIQIDIRGEMLGLASVSQHQCSYCAQVTDIARPRCQVISMSTNCTSSSSLCSSSHWEFIANFTDGVNGTGIASITVRKGNGTLNTSTVAGAGGESITVVTYSASCCAQTVELTAVDNVGNVGKCVTKAQESTTAAPTTLTALVASTGGHTLSMSRCLWITAAVYILWK